jgi:hypothetical protein
VADTGMGGAGGRFPRTKNFSFMDHSKDEAMSYADCKVFDIDTNKLYLKTYLFHILQVRDFSIDKN